MDAQNSDDLQAAARQLAQSPRGLDAAAGLLRWLNDGALSLDVQNQRAVLTLLRAAWGPHAGTARDVLRQLADAQEPAASIPPQSDDRPDSPPAPAPAPSSGSPGATYAAFDVEPEFGLGYPSLDELGIGEGEERISFLPYCDWLTVRVLQGKLVFRDQDYPPDNLLARPGTCLSVLNWPRGAARPATPDEAARSLPLSRAAVPSAPSSPPATGTPASLSAQPLA